jgi:hypothetical protein
MTKIVLGDTAVRSRWFEERNPWHFFDNRQLVKHITQYRIADAEDAPYERLAARALFDEIQGRLQEVGRLDLFQWRSLTQQSAFKVGEIAAQLLQKMQFDPYGYIKNPHPNTRGTLYFVDENPWHNLPNDSLTVAAFFFQYQMNTRTIDEILTLSALLDEIAARCTEAEEAPHWFENWRENSLMDAITEGLRLSQELSQQSAPPLLTNLGQSATNSTAWLQ